MDIAEGLHFERETFIGERVAVLGVTGTGKTNTVAVMIEELLANGLPLTIVDTEGEYYGLKEKYELVVAGRSSHVELTIGPEHAAALARTSVEQGISIILDVSGYKKSEAEAVLEAYFTELWEACSEAKRPYEIVLEEAHIWISQEKNSPLKELLTEIALRGRKRGLGIILSSQRSAKVEKDVLTQVPLLFLHQVVHPIDMKVYQQLIPLPPKEVEKMVRGLERGQAVVRFGSSVQVASIRKRHTFHPGATPEFGEVVQPELRKIDAELLAQLQEVLLASVQPLPKHEKNLEKRIRELEAELAKRDELIQAQQGQIDMLSKITVNGSSTVELPKQVAIALATVGEVHFPADFPRLGSVVVEASEVLHEKLPARSVSSSVPFEEAEFAAFKGRFALVPQMERDVLRLLIQQGPLYASTIATWLKKSEASIKNNPPRELMSLGLIRRERKGKGYLYTSFLVEYLRKKFPGADIPELRKQLLP